jgi:hypothetical protein
MNRFASTGEIADPYEQRWIMRSARRLPSVGVIIAVERCA